MFFLIFKNKSELFLYGEQHVYLLQCEIIQMYLLYHNKDDSHIE